MTPWTLERMTSFLKRAGALKDETTSVAAAWKDTRWNVAAPCRTQVAGSGDGCRKLAEPVSSPARDTELPPLKTYGLGTSKFIYKGPQP